MLIEVFRVWFGWDIDFFSEWCFDLDLENDS